MLYDSLQNKIKPLRDDLMIYPGHGAGSACGKKMARENSDTLGHQKETNYALKEGLSKKNFIKEILTGLTPPPGYFPKNVLMNIKGYENFENVLKRGTTALSVSEFDHLIHETTALVLDTRNPSEFKKGFIPGSWNIGLSGGFAVWVGTLIKDIKQPILLVTEPGSEQEAVTRLARVGYDHSLGFLNGGFQAWQKAGLEIDNIPSVTASKLAEIKNTGEAVILDVRKKSEYDSEHVVGAVNTPLDYIDESVKNLAKDRTYYVHCAGGYRSAIFASILKARGFEHLMDVEGGFTAMKETGRFDVSEYVCPTTML